MRNTNKCDLFLWTLEPVVDVSNWGSSVTANVVKFAIKRREVYSEVERYSRELKVVSWSGWKEVPMCPFTYWSWIFILHVSTFDSLLGQRAERFGDGFIKSRTRLRKSLWKNSKEQSMSKISFEFAKDNFCIYICINIHVDLFVYKLFLCFQI